MKAGWTEVALGDVCDVTMGQAPPGDSYNTDGQGVPLVAGAGDFDGTGLAPTKSTTKPTRVSQAGDIVLSIRASIGARVRADGEYCLGRGVAGLRSKEHLDDRFLWHWIDHAAPVLAAKGRGATFLQVNRKDIVELEMPLPPLEEQERIAAILDKADDLLGKRRAAIAHLDSLTQAIFIDMFGDPASNPRSLKSASIGELCAVRTGATPDRSNGAYFGGHIPWVKTGEVRGNTITETEETITETAIRDTNCAVHPAGSVVVAMYGQGQTRGRCAKLGVAAATNQACAVIPPSDRLRPDFLFWHLRIAYERLRSLGRGGNQPNLNLGLIGDFAVLVPPLRDQDQFGIAAAGVRSVEDSARSAEQDQQMLTTSLQARAFRGEL